MSIFKSKALVTVQSVREANARVITRAPSTGQFVTISSRTISPVRGDVAAAGAVAMRTPVTGKKG